MVGAAGFEPTTPSPPDWCANQAAPRSDLVFEGFDPGGERRRTIVAPPAPATGDFGFKSSVPGPPAAGFSAPSAHPSSASSCSRSSSARPVSGSAAISTASITGSITATGGSSTTSLRQNRRKAATWCRARRADARAAASWPALARSRRRLFDIDDLFDHHRRSIAKVWALARRRGRHRRHGAGRVPSEPSARP